MGAKEEVWEELELVWFVAAVGGIGVADTFTVGRGYLNCLCRGGTHLNRDTMRDGHSIVSVGVFWDNPQARDTNAQHNGYT